MKLRVTSASCRRSIAIILLLLLGVGHGQVCGYECQRFVGCYESFLSHKTKGFLEDDSHSIIPRRFQLLNERMKWAKEGDTWFGIHGIPPGAINNPSEDLWGWTPKGQRIEIVWSTGLGGYRGTLKALKTGDIEGQIEAWCDFRCGGSQERTARIRLKRIVCPTPIEPSPLEKVETPK